MHILTGKLSYTSLVLHSLALLHVSKITRESGLREQMLCIASLSLSSIPCGDQRRPRRESASQSLPLWLLSRKQRVLYALRDSTLSTLFNLTI